MLCLTACSKYTHSNDRTYPALWKVETTGKGQVWLFGTIHSLPKKKGLPLFALRRSSFSRVYFPDWVSQGMRNALRSSDAIVLELGRRPNAEHRQNQHSINGLKKPPQPGPPVLDQLSEKQKSIIIEAANRRGLAERHLRELSATSLLVLFSVLPEQQTTFSGLPGVEDWLRLFARSKQLPILGLESVSDRIDVIVESFRSIDDAHQNEVLVNYVRTSISDAPDPYNELEALYERWTSGDIDAVEEQRVRFYERYPVIYDAFLGIRNQQWIDDIETHINSGRNVFIAVGDGHLIGPNNLRQLLIEAGHTITRVQ